MFIDSVRDDGPRAEWAPYRVVDETRPVIFKVDGPGRLVLKLRTYLEATNREAIGAVLRDGTIVLTARVPAVRDPDVKLVEAGKKRCTKARTFVVWLDAGEHTVSVRYSEGPALLVFATFVAGEKNELANPEDGEVPILDPRNNPRGGNEVQRIGKVAVEGDDVEEIAPDAYEESETATVAGERSALAQKEAWEKKRETAPAEVAASRGPALEERAETNPFQRPPIVEAKNARTLTQPAPYLSFEVRGGVLMSRLGLDIAPMLGGDVRIPIPRLDAKRFTAGLSVDVSYARGQAAVLAEERRVAVAVAKIEKTELDAIADVRVVIARFAELLDPYVAVGGGVSIAALSAEYPAETRRETRVLPIGVLRLGAAFGPLGSRPFFEVSGALANKDATIKAAVGYRFEILGDVPTD